MAMRRRARTKTSRGKTAPWRETRVIDSQLNGGLCLPGLAAECTEEIDGAHFKFPQITAPCATIALYPVVIEEDFQSQPSNWKERIVHTGTDVDVTVQPSWLWMASVARHYFDEIQTQFPLARLIAPWRCALVIYDQDEVDSVAISSLYTEGWQQEERYLPGTYREGRIYHQGSVIESNAAERIRIRSRHRRRLETGEGLYWQFEAGCVEYSGVDTGLNVITANDAIQDFGGGPFWLLGQFRSTYIE